MPAWWDSEGSADTGAPRPAGDGLGWSHEQEPEELPGGLTAHEACRKGKAREKSHLSPFQH